MVFAGPNGKRLAGESIKGGTGSRLLGIIHGAGVGSIVNAAIAAAAGVAGF